MFGEIGKILQEHEPVLLKDFISLVEPITGCWIDGTFGAGGYTRALLQNGACKVLAIDKDSSTKKFLKNIQNEYGDMIKFYNQNFADMQKNNDITLIASSPETKYQIFKYKNHAYGIQFHIEVDENTIIKWSKVPELKNALEKYLGKNSIDQLDKLLRNNIQEMNYNTKKLYENFKNLMTT